MSSGEQQQRDGGAHSVDASPSRLAPVLPFPSIRPERRADDPPAGEPRLRDLIGEVLRDERQHQERTLADVAREAAVSLPYLSEVERGRKEISSDLLSSVCDALEVPLVDVLERCAGRLRAGSQGGSSIQLRAA